MAGVRIRVETGPDEGLEIALCRAQVRIGRGPAANVQLSDQGFLGTLQVKFDRGVYHVANQITDTVGRPVALRLLPPEGSEEWQFPASTEAVWVTGHRIRLTPDTQVVLTADTALDLPDGKHEVSRSRPTAQAKKERDLLYLVLIVVMFGVAGFLFTQDPEQGVARKTDRELTKEYTAIAEQFEKLEETLSRGDFRDKQTLRHAKSVASGLQDARVAEVSGHTAEAADKYTHVRDDLNRLLGGADGTPGAIALPPEHAVPFETARKFVAERVVELGAHIGRDRRVR